MYQFSAGLQKRFGQDPPPPARIHRRLDTLKLKLIYDRQSVCQFVLVSGALLGPVTNFSFSQKILQTVAALLFCSALSDERTGL
jgi:hypothetical protein